MCGAVQDQTQREQQQQQQQGGDGTTAISMEGKFVQQLRQRLGFVADQLHHARRVLKPGGTASLMLVMGPADCASVAIVALLLRSLRRDATAPAVRLLGTMHIHKPPIYVLAQQLRLPSDGDAEAQRAWETLTDADALTAAALSLNAAAARAVGQSSFAEASRESVAAQDARFEAVNALFGFGAAADVAEEGPSSSSSFLRDDLECIFRQRTERLEVQRRRAEERLAAQRGTGGGGTVG